MQNFKRPEIRAFSSHTCLILISYLLTLSLIPTPVVRAQGDLYSFPSGAIGPAGNLAYNPPILFELSPQIVTVSPGQTVTFTVRYQTWTPPEMGTPAVIWQLFAIVSWTPKWPPPASYYVPLYDGAPGRYPGVSQTQSFSVTVPSTPGTYYIWFCYNLHYSMGQAITEFTNPLPLPAHIKIIVRSSEGNEVLKLPAGAWYPGDLSPHTILLDINVAGQGQVAIVTPGQTISVSYTMQIFANPSTPGEIRQAFFGYSWASSWPPLDAHTEIYNGMPGPYPGVTKTDTFNIKVPTQPGSYNIWLLGGSEYNMHDAVVAHKNPPTVLPHAKIIVQQQEYYLKADFSGAVINGQALSGSNPEIKVQAGAALKGYLEVSLDNNRGGPWITPVIGTQSWTRNNFYCVISDAPTGKSRQRYTFSLTAPSTPGTYYIGMFAGWMYTCDEVASNDHPALFGDGDDVWDMPIQGWEEVIANGQASTGPYKMPGRAIRIIVYVAHGGITEFTYVSGNVIIPRGGMSDRVNVKYLCDTNPANGWNTDLRFNDANWLEGRTPIGIGEDRFIRTKLPFNDLYVRKIFLIDKICRNAILSIASDDGADVWINGKKILNDLNSVHGPGYWNYRLNITDHLKMGENLLAVHVKNSAGGPCYFDFELLLQEDGLEDIVFNFIKGRLNPDGGFSNDHIDDTFYATSILKILNSINVIDKEKVGFWILSHKFMYGDFGNWVAWQHPAVESLKNLGLELDSESTERLITVLINWRSSDGSWGSNLWDTWHAVEALASLNALNRIRDWERTVSFIKSLQRGDGGFSNRPGETTYLRFTFYAIRSLQLLNAVNSIDRGKAISFIKSCYKNGGFSDRPGWGEWVESTYWGVESLEILNSLNEVDSGKIADKAISWLGDKGSTGYLYGDYCVVMTLRILNKLDLLDKVKLVNNVMNFQNIIDGGFKYGSRLYDTEHALRILSNMGMLNRVDEKKIEQWVSSQPFYYWSTGDIHSAIYCLKTLNALQKADVKKVVDELLKHQLPDGGFGGDENWRESNLWETYLAIDTLHMLNRISSINKENVINYVLSLRKPDGSFRYSRSEENYDRATPLAVTILTSLEEAHRIDEKTINWIIKNQREDGGFGDILNTYLSLRALRDVGRLDNTILTKAVNYALSLQNLDGGFGWWRGDMWSWLDSTDYATGSLKISTKIDKYFILVSSQYGVATGSGWYKTGETATISISSIIVEKDFFTNAIFEGWRLDGSIVSTSPTYSFVVDRPITLVASWRTEVKPFTIGLMTVVILIVIVPVTVIIAKRRKPTLPRAQPPPQPSIPPPLPILPSKESETEKEIKKYEEYLEKLEQLRKEGEVSETVYEKLKEEYEKKIEELIGKMRSEVK
ncbi:MAG: prenyltransferase/squalene oxidase repeat-containing protein [Thermoproteota archaeon]